MELQVDPNRMRHMKGTGIFIRAKNDGKWDSVDIAALDKKSLLSFLRSRGGENEWAENVVGILLFHGNFDFDKSRHQSE